MAGKKFLPILVAAALIMAGCAGYVLRRGMLNGAYISTARPEIAIKAADMPLLASGEGTTNMVWTGMIGGLPVHVWFAAYGTGGLAPLAIAAQAQVPSGWNWESDLRPTFSVDHGTEVFNGVAYQACTFIVNPAASPFGGLITGTRADGSPQLWIARYFAARFNLGEDKIIMEYLEPLPDGVTSLTSLPLGQANLLAQVAQRAREAFVVGNAPKNPEGVAAQYNNDLAWGRMDQKFLGGATRIDWMPDYF